LGGRRRTHERGRRYHERSFAMFSNSDRDGVRLYTSRAVNRPKEVADAPRPVVRQGRTR